MGDQDIKTSQSPHANDDKAIRDSSTAQQNDASGTNDHQPSDSRPGSPSGDSQDESTQKSSVPLQKRRRVTRACDECRRKKIKCDGKQPCTHCTVYSYECTYDQPSNRRRNPAPQYIEALEQRLQKAEAILRSVLPGLDLDDPKFDTRTVEQIVDASKASAPAPNPKKAPCDANKSEDDAQIQTMIDRTGSLDLDDSGNWDFRGHSSGYVFMRKFRAQFGDGYLADSKAAAAKNRTKAHILESPRSANSSPYDFNLPGPVDLPRREVAIELCRNTIDDCCALMRPIHRPTFFKRLHSLYDTEPEQYNNSHVQFLPLLYVVMAVGCMFSKPENEYTMLDIKGYKEAMEQGYQYFNIAKQMLDITDCRDLMSLQAVLFMILFLQSSAKLPTCYAYVGIAMRGCCRLGLHRNIPNKFNPIEAEERKRIFWLVRKLDSYVGAVLGLPQMLSDDDIDQEYPMEVDDEYITSEGIRPMPAGTFCLLRATNAHTKLTNALRKVVRYIYPIKEMAENPNEKRYSISHRRIRELERELQTWMDELPMELRPSDNANRDLSRVQQLLRISYAHVQMMIYRPFIHYVSQSCQSKNIDKRSFACAAACISVARNIVHITSEMKRRGLLGGSYWFVMYTTYFAILSLVYYVIENPNSPTSQDILRDAVEGRDTLASLARRSMAADRCTASLTSLFDVLPERLKEKRNSLKPTPSTSRKRPPPAATDENLNTSQSNIPTPNSLRDNMGTPLRARTFPADFLAKLAKRNSMPDSNPFISYGEGAAHVPQIVGFASPSTASPLSSGFDYTPHLGNAQLPDLKNVMFPSDNPFAYPNQPISTLESSGDGQFLFPDHSMNSFDNFPAATGVTSAPNEQNIYDTPALDGSGSLLHNQQQQQPTPTLPQDFDYDYSFNRSLNEPSSLMQPYGGQAGQFGASLTDMLMQNSVGTESGQFNLNNIPSHAQSQSQGQGQSGMMGMGDLTNSAPATDGGLLSDEQYWDHLQKVDMTGAGAGTAGSGGASLKSGFGAGSNDGYNNGSGMNDIFTSDGWLPSWEQAYASNPQQ